MEEERKVEWERKAVMEGGERDRRGRVEEVKQEREVEEDEGKKRGR